MWLDGLYLRLKESQFGTELESLVRVTGADAELWMTDITMQVRSYMCCDSRGLGFWWPRGMPLAHINVALLELRG